MPSPCSESYELEYTRVKVLEEADYKQNVTINHTRCDTGHLWLLANMGNSGNTYCKFKY